MFWTRFDVHLYIAELDAGFRALGYQQHGQRRKDSGGEGYSREEAKNVLNPHQCGMHVGFDGGDLLLMFGMKILEQLYVSNSV